MMSTMTKYDLANIVSDMKAWRHQIHQHPETAYSEFETARLVADILKNAGIEVYENIAVTGVVGVLKKGTSNKSIALRADMDALHIQELNSFEHQSKIKGKMHACGHDGHTAMLLGAAVYLAKTQNFDGTVYFIFQPAEENEGGAKRMIEEGIFNTFQIDQIYGLHNFPGLPVGQFAICSGEMMSSYATFQCQIIGQGTHSSMPDSGINPIPIAIEIYQAWQAYFQTLSAESDEKINVTVTQIHTGDEDNVIPEVATLSGSTRCYQDVTSEQIKNQMQAMATKICQKNQARCTFNYHLRYPSLINWSAETETAIKAATNLVGHDNVNANLEPLTGSEDFAFFLQKKQGAYILLGNAGEKQGMCMVHNPYYDFNDDILALGASYWIKLTENVLSC